MFRTSNPALSSDAFSSSSRGAKMTINGAVNKTAILVSIVFLAAWWSWNASLTTLPEMAKIIFVPTPWMIVGALGGLVLSILTIWKKKWAPFTAPLYAAFEGVFLGGASAGFEMAYPGIAFQAILATAGTLVALLMAYKSGVIRPTENFKLGIFAATGGIFVVYLINMIMGFFGSGIPSIFDSGPIGIGFSLIVVTIAALNLVLDFDFIEKGEQHGAPQYMEWYAAFSLLVTLVWLYIEILRLLAKLRDR